MRILSAVVLALLVACANDAAPLVASDVVVKRGPPGTMQMSSAYFDIANNTSAAVTITAVTSPQYQAVDMHETVIEDGVARMRALDGFVIAPNSSVSFAPGARHLMLMRPVNAEGGQVTLEFHSGDSVLLTVTVAVSE